MDYCKVVAGWEWLVMALQWSTDVQEYGMPARRIIIQAIDYA